MFEYRHTAIITNYLYNNKGLFDIDGLKKAIKEKYKNEVSFYQTSYSHSRTRYDNERILELVLSYSISTPNNFTTNDFDKFYGEVMKLKNRFNIKYDITLGTKI